MDILKFVMIGLFIGSVSGVLGIGGGVLLVPALIWLCDFDTKKAAGTSLAILIPPIGLPAAWRAYNERLVDIEAALWIAGAFTIGAYVSRGLVHFIEVHWFRLIFGVIMVFVAVRFMIDSDSEAKTAAAGLTAALLAWLAYWGLKVLGRRPRLPPTVGEQIQQKQGEGWGERDYQI
jgi:uncharacterized membrane protein YfcA